MMERYNQNIEQQSYAQRFGCRDIVFCCCPFWAWVGAVWLYWLYGLKGCCWLANLCCCWLGFPPIGTGWPNHLLFWFGFYISYRPEEYIYYSWWANDFLLLGKGSVLLLKLAGTSFELNVRLGSYSAYFYIVSS